MQDGGAGAHPAKSASEIAVDISPESAILVATTAYQQTLNQSSTVQGELQRVSCGCDGDSGAEREWAGELNVERPFRQVDDSGLPPLFGIRTRLVSVGSPAPEKVRLARTLRFTQGFFFSGGTAGWPKAGGTAGQKSRLVPVCGYSVAETRFFLLPAHKACTDRAAGRYASGEPRK